MLDFATHVGIIGIDRRDGDVESDDGRAVLDFESLEEILFAFSIHIF